MIFLRQRMFDLFFDKLLHAAERQILAYFLSPLPYKAYPHEGKRGRKGFRMSQRSSNMLDLFDDERSIENPIVLFALNIIYMDNTISGIFASRVVYIIERNRIMRIHIH